MHDPATVICDIPNPFSWRKCQILGWRMGSLATIWHVDPESDGSDDSCGWTFPKLTKEQKGNISFLAWCESEKPWFQAELSKNASRPADAECLLRGAFLAVARSIGAKITWDDACLWSSELIHGPVDKFRSSLCHLPGWHSNFGEDRKDQRERSAESLFFCIARFILRMRRPWWKHPRWHFWHWKIQFQPVFNSKHQEAMKRS